MEFYIGWSHSDAIYSDYFPRCPMLISAVPSNNRPFRKFKTHPSKLIVDSGAFHYANNLQKRKVRDVFQAQLDIVQDADSAMEIQLVHADEPMLNKDGLSERYRAMEQTLFNAYEYMRLFSAEALPRQVLPMGVIQGFDLASIQYSVHELVKMGYRQFGIGSLVSRHPQQQMDFIGQAAALVGAERLHVFGVTGLPQIRKMAELGIASFDSTRPTMAAAYYQVFYSEPFRTFALETCHIAHQIPRLNQPLPCDCPACRERPEDILIPAPRTYMKLRSIHNYYHLLRTIRKFQQEQERESYAVSDVLRSGNQIDL